MRKLILSCALVFFATGANAQNLLETNPQLRERLSYENYQTNDRGQFNVTGAPLGGYSEPLGVVTPYGVHEPGQIRSFGYSETDLYSPDYSYDNFGK